MIRYSLKRNSCGRRQAGYTIVELLLVFLITGILAALALPPFLQWRATTEYRQATREIVSALRDARNRTISTNRQYCVEFDFANRKYGIRAGNRAYATDWSDLASNPTPSWTDLPLSVRLSKNPVAIPRVAFNPNGTAMSGTSGSILIQDTSLNTRFTIQVEPSGKIKVL